MDLWGGLRSDRTGGNNDAISGVDVGGVGKRSCGAAALHNNSDLLQSAAQTGVLSADCREDAFLVWIIVWGRVLDVAVLGCFKRLEFWR